MLGCHEFCGYYEWTFHFVRRTFGQQAVRDLWAEAIGGDSQRHYAQAGLDAGLRGLLGAWVKTGEEEACDWSFTLDEEKNVLRWDMRRCPSKGFLIQSDRNADEDYCDHCAGWVIPLLEQVGAEVVVHEHNHCGQCWGMMRMKDRPAQPPDVPGDVRNDPRWKHGYVETWHSGKQLPAWPEWGASTDPAELIESRFAACDKLCLVTSGVALAACQPVCSLSKLDGALADKQPVPPGDPSIGLLACDRTYLAMPTLEPSAVLIGQENVDLAALAERYRRAPAERRPLLLHPYWLALPQLDFVSSGLPRPVPLLPLLIRKGVYVHRPHAERPKASELLELLARALGKPLVPLENQRHA